MGTTLSSVHVYTPNAISDMEDFYSFSNGWQTYLPEEPPEDPFEYRPFAKKISKRIDAPVLWFYIFDSESIWFEFYQNGKRVSAYSQQDLTGTKNLYGVPALVGYEGDRSVVYHGYCPVRMWIFRLNCLRSILVFV